MGTASISIPPIPRCPQPSAPVQTRSPYPILVSVSCTPITDSLFCIRPALLVLAAHRTSAELADDCSRCDALYFHRVLLTYAAYSSTVGLHWLPSPATVYHFSLLVSLYLSLSPTAHFRLACVPLAPVFETTWMSHFAPTLRSRFAPPLAPQRQGGHSTVAR